jgi:hypothetical protein
VTGFLILALASGAGAAEVQACIRHHPVLVGDFVQSRKVKGFRRALVSRGHFTLTRGEGIRWVTTEPFASELVVSPDEVSSRQGDAELFRLGVKEPATGLVLQLLFASLAGDLEVLTKHFDVEAHVEGCAWSVLLTPKPGLLSRAFSRVELSGRQYVESVRLVEVSGDETHVTLSNSRPAP